MSVTLDLGDWRLDLISGGTLRLDGGTMFGVVPRDVWSKAAPPDEHNRVRMATHCVLARGHGTTVLIDTGYGGCNSPRQQEQARLEPGEPLLASLAAVGVAPAEIDVVVFSHLHFDHAGGATRRAQDGAYTPAFSRARYVVQRREWIDAMSRAPELRGSYRDDLLACWEQESRLQLIDGDATLAPGMRVVPTGGHTHGHQIVWIEGAGGAAVYSADLCPSRAHLRQMWCLGYDVELLESRRKKAALLREVADRQAWLILDHDPDVSVCRIAVDEKTEFRVLETRDAAESSQA